MIYVVVVNKSYLQELIEYVQQSELKLLAIDIVELALRNLAIYLVIRNLISAASPLRGCGKAQVRSLFIERATCICRGNLI